MSTIAAEFAQITAVLAGTAVGTVATITALALWDDHQSQKQHRAHMSYVPSPTLPDTDRKGYPRPVY